MPAPAPAPARSKNPRDHMVNVWGYSHLNFFAPMSRFGSGALGAGWGQGRGQGRQGRQGQRWRAARRPPAAWPCAAPAPGSASATAARASPPSAGPLAACLLAPPVYADGAGPLAAAREFKEMVRALHGAGIEVILDVVYNHTAEGEGGRAQGAKAMSGWMRCLRLGCGVQPHGGGCVCLVPIQGHAWCLRAGRGV